MLFSHPRGPGQGMVLRCNKFPMRLDWDLVTKYVLDQPFAFAERHPKLDFDTSHIVVLGASMGG